MPIILSATSVQLPYVAIRLAHTRAVPVGMLPHYFAAGCQCQAAACSLGACWWADTNHASRPATRQQQQPQSRLGHGVSGGLESQPAVHGTDKFMSECFFHA